jgi:hypothetical protein
VTEFETTGYVKDHKLTVRNQRAYADAMARWPDGEVIVRIQKAHATRKSQANRLYWAGFVRPISEYTGYEPHEVHEFLKRKFLPSHHLMIQNKAGEVVEETDLPPSSAKLNELEFSDYLRRIRIWAFETLGIECGSRQEAA